MKKEKLINKLLFFFKVFFKIISKLNTNIKIIFFHSFEQIWEIIFIKANFNKAKKIAINIRSKLDKASKNMEDFSLSKKKLFCILEQGNSVNDELTSKRKQIFNTNFSDLKRLNWANNKDDKLADYFSENICWSEGRSLLYEKVRGKYDFYIFIDDDIDIQLKGRNSKDIAEVLKNQLIKYKPIHGSIPNNTWPKKYFSNNYGETFQMKGGDLCIQLFRDDFASLMFPTWKHGSGKSMWYCPFIAHILFPNESLYLNKFRAINIRQEVHSDYELENYSKPREITNYFEKKIKDKPLRNLFKAWRKYSTSEFNISDEFRFKKKIIIQNLNELIYQ